MINPVLLENLKFLFHPKTVAVIGASENPGKLGFHVMKSLLSGGFEGQVLPINPGARQILGIRALPSLVDFPGSIDLAVVVLPANLVRGIFEQCIVKGVKGIVLITAGFKEIEDPRGADLQNTISRLATDAAIPVIGPNTFGMINLHQNLNASFTPQFSQLRKGSLSLVSQSGGMSHLLAFTAMRRQVRFSKIVGLGNRLNVDFAEMVAYLVEDPDTKVILLYIEGLEAPRNLMEMASKNRGRKPILAYKTGSAASGDRASLSHTGSMAGKGEIYEGAFRQAGILHLKDAGVLIDTAHALAKCPLPAGNRVAILSGQAGPGMAACDICEMEGLEIAAFSPNTQRTINALLPPLALRTNPIDLGPAWYDASVLSDIVRAVMQDENVDAVLLLMMFASANRTALSGLKELLLGWGQKKPVITCFLSPPGIWDDEVLALEDRDAVVNLPTPERAAKVAAMLWRYNQLINRV